MSLEVSFSVFVGFSSLAFFQLRFQFLEMESLENKVWKCAASLEPRSPAFICVHLHSSAFICVHLRSPAFSKSSPSLKLKPFIELLSFSHVAKPRDTRTNDNLTTTRMIKVSLSSSNIFNTLT